MSTISTHAKMYWQVLTLMALIVLSAPAITVAGVTITYPDSGTLVSSPFLGLTGPTLLPAGSFAGNLVTVNGGTMNYAFGAGNESNRALSNNTLIINGGRVRYDAFGAYSENGGTLTGNTLIINNGSMRAVYGAKALQGGAVVDNKIIMSGGTVSSGIVGGESINGNAVGNSVTLNGGSVGLYIRGGWGSLATGNSVNIAGGTVAGSVYGGDATGSAATGNSVVITGGKISGNVYGGHGTSTANATGNSVVITGGSVTGDIYGGHVTGNNASATGNSVTIADKASLNSTTTIHGGSEKTGNTLHIRNWRGTVANVSNFANYTFSLPEGMAPGDTALTLVGGSQTDLDSTRIRHSAYMGGGTRFAVGDSVNLLKNTSGISTSSINLAGGRVQQGISLMYDYTLSATGNAVSMTFTSSPQLLQQTRAVAQGHATALSSVNMGADLVAGGGMDNARQAASTGLSSGDSTGTGGIAAFAAINGSSLHYDVGGGTDVRGTSLMLGLAKTWNFAPMDLLVGAFFETGFSNSNSDGYGVSGTGSGRYTGGGIMARVDITESLLKGLYLEASLRSGMQSSLYEGQGMTNHAGDSASYSVDSPYVGMHGGLGYVWNITEQASLDVYSKYFWTRQHGSDVRIMGDPYSFKDVDSHRLRAGGRFSYAIYDWFSPYIGAAYEHEFDGKGRVTTYGLDVPAPSIKGGTGIGELGVSFQPTAAQGLNIDLGVQGYTGKRSGITGNLQLRLEF